jgi:TolB protein
MNPDGTGLLKLNKVTSFDGYPAWSPDGTEIVFQSSRTGGMDLYTIKPDGSNVAVFVANAALDETPDWQPIPAA